MREPEERRGACRLALGDCHKLLKNIETDSADLILTDPPYNLQKYSRGNIHAKGRKPLNNNIAPWDGEAVDFPLLQKELVRILKPEGNMFIFTAYNLLGVWHSLFDPLFDTFQIMVWHKTNPPPRLRKSGFLNSCELICCLWNKGHKWNFTTQKKMHNFFESPVCKGKERLPHPTQKPVRLLRHIIQIASDKGDCALDPFMGTGSTGAACQELGRRFVGIEKDPAVFKMAQERLGRAARAGAAATEAPFREKPAVEKAPLPASSAA